jgi:hypothetical protein
MARCTWRSVSVVTKRCAPVRRALGDADSDLTVDETNRRGAEPAELGALGKTLQSWQPQWRLSWDASTEGVRGMATDAHDGQVPAAEARGQRVLDLLDKAIDLQSPLVRKNIARARQRNPEATPAEVIRALERMYISALTGTGAAVGGTAAAPGVGTGVALALSAGEALSSLELTALFALSIAEVHGVAIDESSAAERS